jgi:predicted Ser/Thr protein kinase
VAELHCKVCGQAAPHLDALGYCPTCAARHAPGPNPTESIADASQLFVGLLDEPDPLLGRELSGCRLLRRAGGGGMGTVYRAEQLSLGRIVAIKVIHADHTASPKFVARLRAEARVVAALSHPNILQVYDVGTSGTLHYIVMEFVDGPSLGDLIFQGVFQDAARCLDILRQTLLGLGHAHSRGVIHRDIKPDNILLAGGRYVKLADFGLAKLLTEQDQRLTATGMVLGTPLYMSPEAAYGKPLDPRSDIYSLGASFYHALSGVPPFSGDSAMGILYRHIHESPPPLLQVNPVIDPAVSAVLMKMLEKDPEQRFASCEDALAALDTPQDRGSNGDVRLARIQAATGSEAAAAKTLEMARRPPVEPAPQSAEATVQVQPMRVTQRRAWIGLAALLAVGIVLGWTGLGRQLAAGLGSGLLRLLRSSANLETPAGPGPTTAQAGATAAPGPAETTGTSAEQAAAPSAPPGSPDPNAQNAVEAVAVLPPGTSAPAAPETPAAFSTPPEAETQGAELATALPAASEANLTPATSEAAPTLELPTLPPDQPPPEPTVPEGTAAVPEVLARNLLDQFAEAKDVESQEKLAAAIVDAAGQASPEQGRWIRERLAYLRFVKARDKARDALSHSRFDDARAALAEFKAQVPEADQTQEVRMLKQRLVVQIEELELHAACESFLQLVMRENWSEASYAFPAKRCRFPSRPNPKKVIKSVSKVLQLPAGAKIRSFQIQGVRVDPEATNGWTRLSLDLEGDPEAHVQSVLWAKSCGKWRLDAEPIDKGLLGLGF